VAAAKSAGAAVVELHTGAYCDAVREHSAAAPGLLAKLQAAACEAARLGLEVHAGHGIDYETVKPVAGIAEVIELNIGHFLIGEAIFIGLGPAIQRMRMLMDEARAKSETELAQIVRQG
jgi:pyridoxine 5-phosphate synthase